MVAECDSVAAVGDAGDRDAGDEQQLVRGVCVAAAEYCGEPEFAGWSENAGALLQHGGVYGHAAICDWDEFAKSGPRAWASRGGLDDRKDVSYH